MSKLIENGNGYKALRILHYISVDLSFDGYMTKERIYTLHLKAIKKDPAGFVKAMKSGLFELPSGSSVLSDLQIRNLLEALAEEHPLFALRLIYMPEVTRSQPSPSVKISPLFERQSKECFERVSDSCFWQVVSPEFSARGGKLEGWDLMILLQIALMKDSPGDFSRLEEATQVINRLTVNFNHEFMFFRYLIEQLEGREEQLRFVLLRLDPRFLLKVLELGSKEVVETLHVEELANLIFDFDKRGFLPWDSAASINNFFLDFFQKLPDFNSPTDGTASEDEASKRKAVAVLEVFWRSSQSASIIKRCFEFLIGKLPEEELFVIMDDLNPNIAKRLRNWKSKIGR